MEERGGKPRDSGSRGGELPEGLWRRKVCGEGARMVEGKKTDICSNERAQRPVLSGNFDPLKQRTF